MLTDIGFDNDDFASFIVEFASGGLFAPMDILFSTAEIMEFVTTGLNAPVNILFDVSSTMEIFE